MTLLCANTVLHWQKACFYVVNGYGQTEAVPVDAIRDMCCEQKCGLSNFVYL